MVSDRFNRFQTMSVIPFMIALCTIAPLDQAQAGSVGDALNELANRNIVHNKLTFAELGIEKPMSLSSFADQRHIYIPVPANVNLTDMTLSLNGQYVRADGGQTSYTLSVDDYVVAAHSPEDDSGTVKMDLLLDGKARPDGFVNVIVNWASSPARHYCDNRQPIGNILQILPTTYLEYSYLASDVDNIYTAWSALPKDVSLLVSSNNLTQEAYSAAWSVGVAMTSADKHVKIISLPKIGDTVDVSGLSIPSALSSIPAFKALSGGGHITLRDAAQVGAFIMLQSELTPNMAIVDSAMQEKLSVAFTALGKQVATTDSDAVSAMDQLTILRTSLGQKPGKNTVSLKTFSGRPVIAISPDAGASAANLIKALWLKTARAESLVLGVVDIPADPSESILDNNAARLDIIARGDWTSKIDIGSYIAKGKVPDKMAINVSAAPGANDTSPVATVFINNYLLGAKRLTADGNPEQILVKLPNYVLQAQNTLRVQFQRQISSNECRETPQGYPAAVLPGSQIWMTEMPPPTNLASLALKLSEGSVVGVSSAWLSNALATLPTAISVASASQISPSRTDFQVFDGTPTAMPDAPFLFFNVPIENAKHRISVTGNMLSISDGEGNVHYEASGLEDVGVVEAIIQRGHLGISYHTVGLGPTIEKPFQLGPGEIEIVGSEGVLKSIRGQNADLSINRDFSDKIDGVVTSLSLLKEESFWLNRIPLIITVIVIGGFLLVLVLAMLARRRHKDSEE